MSAIDRLLRDSLPYLKRRDRGIDRVLNCSIVKWAQNGHRRAQFSIFLTELQNPETSHSMVSVSNY